MPFTIKQGDTSPSLLANLVLPDKTPAQLAGSTVLFHMRNSRGTGSTLVGSATIVNASAGQVRYDWDPADTALVGDYEAEFQVTYSDGKIETFPNDGFLEVSIPEQLA